MSLAMFSPTPKKQTNKKTRIKPYACDCGVFPLTSFFYFHNNDFASFPSHQTGSTINFAQLYLLQNLSNLSHERKRWQYLNDSP